MCRPRPRPRRPRGYVILLTRGTPAPRTDHQTQKRMLGPSGGQVLNPYSIESVSLPRTPSGVNMIRFYHTV
jgi:hypothetical protein